MYYCHAQATSPILLNFTVVAINSTRFLTQQQKVTVKIVDILYHSDEEIYIIPLPALNVLLNVLIWLKKKEVMKRKQLPF